MVMKYLRIALVTCAIVAVSWSAALAQMSPTVSATPQPG